MTEEKSLYKRIYLRGCSLLLAAKKIARRFKRNKKKRKSLEVLSWWEKRIQRASALSFVIPTAAMVVSLSFLVEADTRPASKQATEIVHKILEVLLEKAETIAIVSAAVLFYKEAPSRKKQRRYESWQVVDSAAGIDISYARYQALEDLNSDGASLKGLRASNAYLQGINLNYAILSEAILAGANLQDAKLQKARLEEACLCNAILLDALLQESDLYQANLTKADLTGAILKGAILTGALLEGANLAYANLDKADLEYISWDAETIWPDKANVAKAINVPPDLKDQLGIQSVEH